MGNQNGKSKSFDITSHPNPIEINKIDIDIQSKSGPGLNLAQAQMGQAPMGQAQMGGAQMGRAPKMGQAQMGGAQMGRAEMGQALNGPGPNGPGPNGLGPARAIVSNRNRIEIHALEIESKESIRNQPCHVLLQWRLLGIHAL